MTGTERVARETGLTIRGLTVRIPIGDSWVHAASEVDLDVEAGQVMALVGESGCGKSILASAVIAMLPVGTRTHGSVTAYCRGRRIEVSSARGFRGSDIALVPQSASTHLTPVRTARSQLDEYCAVHGVSASANDLARRVGLNPADLDRYPHELSGGMAQRVAIAAALAGEPSVIVADEPTSSLDGDATDRILRLLRSCADSGAAVLLITHDLSSLLRTGVADRVAVMYASRIMETGPARAVLTDPRHDYTRDLLGALPMNGMTPLPGTPPTLTDLPDECVYHLRRPESEQSGGPTSMVRTGDRCWRTRSAE